MKLLIQIVLWIVIIFLGYQLFNSVYEPTKFNKEKEIRYAKVIDQLKDIREAELAHLQVTGKFTSSFDSLVNFINTAEFAITQRRDTIYDDVERNKAFGVTGYYIEDVIIDTLRFVSVRDSLFRDSDRYRNLEKIDIEGKEVLISLNAGFITRSDKKIPVFEAIASKDDVLHDLSKDLVIQEKENLSVAEVNGSHIRVGSMTDVNTNGNWPQLYDKAGEQQ